MDQYIGIEHVKDRLVSGGAASVVIHTRSPFQKPGHGIIEIRATKGPPVASLQAGEPRLKVGLV
ncbi:hypothetical protein PS3A_01590 [Pseudomonas sp. 3A(2025)]